MSNNKTIYDIAVENDFRILTAYTKPVLRGGEFSRLRIVSNTWPYILIEYEGTTLTRSPIRGEIRIPLYDFGPTISTAAFDTDFIQSKRIPQAAKAFTDAATIMSDLKEINPPLPMYREVEP